jgi:hypothetical protein
MAYDVVTVELDLATSSAGRTIVEAGKPIAHVALEDFPAGADLSMSFGGGPWKSITREFAYDLCGEESSRGIKILHAAQPGVSFELLVSYGGIRSLGGG